MPSSASAPPVLYPLSLHDALPIYLLQLLVVAVALRDRLLEDGRVGGDADNGVVLHLPLELAGLEQVAREVVDPDALAERGQLVQVRSEEHTSELQSHSDLVCRLLLPRPPFSTLFPYTTLFRSISFSCSS